MKKLTLTTLICLAFVLIGTIESKAQRSTLGPYYFNLYPSKTYDVKVSGKVTSVQGAPFISWKKGYGGSDHYVLTLEADDVRIWANSPGNKNRYPLYLEIFFFIENGSTFYDTKHTFYIPLER